MTKQFEWFVLRKYGTDGGRISFEDEQRVMNEHEREGWEVHKIWDDAIYFRREIIPTIKWPQLKDFTFTTNF